jgi:hypothetical protein
MQHNAGPAADHTLPGLPAALLPPPPAPSPPPPNSLAPSVLAGWAAVVAGNITASTGLSHLHHGDSLTAGITGHVRGMVALPDGSGMYFLNLNPFDVTLSIFKVGAGQAPPPPGPGANCRLSAVNPLCNSSHRAFGACPEAVTPLPVRRQTCAPTKLQSYGAGNSPKGQLGKYSAQLFRPIMQGFC